MSKDKEDVQTLTDYVLNLTLTDDELDKVAEGSTSLSDWVKDVTSGEEKNTFGHMVKLLKSLKIGDRIEVTPVKGKKRKFKVTDEWNNQFRDIGIIAKGTPHGRLRGQGGSIRVSGRGVLFQPTMLTQVERVASLKKVK